MGRVETKEKGGERERATKNKRGIRTHLLEAQLVHMLGRSFGRSLRGEQRTTTNG
jgi:hypothetical protein